MTSLPTGTVTFMFSDVEGSTQLLHALGDRAGSILDRHDTLMREAIVNGGGVVLTTEGDSFFAVFTDARGAASAAIEAQRALQRESWPPEGGVAVRIGVHTGRGELGGADYRGIDVNRAARIAAAGHGGQILVSDTTRAVIGSEVQEGARLIDLGEYRLKDFEQPHRLWQLVAPGLGDAFPALAARPAGTVDLPAISTTFVGRRAELNRIAELLSTTRLLTLTGPGGAGKSRLAIEAARRLAHHYDAVGFVPLASVTDPELVAPTIAERLEVDSGRTDTVERLIKHLAGSRRLLVLDNLEQVLEGAGVVGELLASVGSLVCLATSRAPLRLSGEIEYPVPPLGGSLEALTPASVREHDAAALFRERVRAIRPEFEIDDSNAAAVTAITTRLDGLPLAIELAAARTRLLGPAELADRLASSLDLLRTGDTDRPERQKTLGATIAWSYDLLEPGQQELFRQLAVFQGGWDLDALEALCFVPDEHDLLAELETLVAHSLVRSDPTPLGTRFALLATIRVFAWERVLAAGEDEFLLDRHYRHYATLGERAAPELLKAGRGEWLSRISADLENFRAALRWVIEMRRGTEACLLAGYLWRYWHTRGDLAEGRRWTDEALAIPGSDPLARLGALEAAGGLAYWAADIGGASRFYGEALNLARVHGGEADLANALYNVSFALGFDGTWDDADVAIDEALAIYQSMGAVEGIARTHWARGTFATLRSDFESARQDFEEALKLYAELDDQFQLGWSHRMLATTLLDLGRPEAARPHLGAGMSIFTAANDTSGIVLMLRDVAKLAILEGDDAGALVLVGAYRSLQDRTGLDLVEVHNEIHELDEVRSRVGRERAAELEAGGAALATEEAVALAVDRLRAAPPAPDLLHPAGS